MLIPRLQKRKGFTLVETLVAITILMISVVGPLVFASQGLTNAMYARDQITAFYLAQDAVEQIRNIRDTNAIKARNGDGTVTWTTGLDKCFSNAVGCQIDSTGGGPYYASVTDCSTTCAPMAYDPTTYIYRYNTAGDTQTNFTRTIKMQTVTPDEVEINVTISWKTGIISRSFSVRENIFKWSQ